MRRLIKSDDLSQASSVPILDIILPRVVDGFPVPKLTRSYKFFVDLYPVFIIRKYLE